MLTHLLRIRKKFTASVALTFLFTMAMGFAALLALGLLNAAELQRLLSDPWFVAYLVTLTAWVVVHFRHFLDPVFKWVEYDRNNQDAPRQLYKRLRVFTRSYWGILLFYSLVTPLLVNLTLSHTLLYKGTEHTLLFIGLHAVVVYFIAMPTYLSTLDSLGQLVRFLGIEQVYHGLRSRLWHVGAVIPLSSLVLVAAFYNNHLPIFSLTTLLFFVGLALVTVATTAVSIRAVKYSLLPVQDVFNRSGASTNTDLARLKPQSTDEIGYLVHTISKVFKRLADQQSHMHAVVNNAAEGIIVVDALGHIDTFNMAAESLFGYDAQETKGQLLSKYLPGLTGANHVPRVVDGEQEIEGIHRNGRRISMSVRVSAMHMSDKTMYTCLVADITARKAAQLKQKKAEARYRDLVETAHDLVWSIEPSGQWTYLNKAAKDIYGLDPSDMIGRNISDFRDPDHAKQESSAFAEILNGKELYQFETVHLDKDGHQHYLSFNAKAQTDILGKVQKISGTARDISEKKAFERQLTFQAEHDVLTQLLNRRYFQRELERVVARVTRSAGSCGLLYIDLDQFKYINDTLGHAAGDGLLVEISELLSTNVREGELLARFGGDEFTVLLYNLSPTALLSVAEKFRALFENYRYLHTGNSFNLTCSIGAALIDNSVHTADEAMAHADLACHMAKSKGRNCVHLYDRGDESEAGMTADMGWAGRVREMLEQDRFILVFQPIVSVKTGNIHSHEVLIRMPCDDGQIILPGGFLPAAERFGLMQSIDRWVVRKSIEKLQHEHALGNRAHFSINLSAKAFEDDSLGSSIRKWLRKSGIEPRFLTFEITESAAITNLNRAIKLIQELKDIGCCFALDDFGSGFSSFTYLKHLPADIIKIDGAFVKGLEAGSVEEAMVISMNQVAHALNKETIAECVESRETYDTLVRIGVDYVQGNFLCKPTAHITASETLSVAPIQISA